MHVCKDIPSGGGFMCGIVRVKMQNQLLFGMDPVGLLWVL